MSEEYGVFSDEGFLEGDLYSVAEAEAAIAARYDKEDGCYVALVCPEHRDQEKDHCETCNPANDPEDDLEEEDDDA